MQTKELLATGRLVAAVPEPLVRQARAAAQRDRRTLSAWLRILVETHLDRTEGGQPNETRKTP